jgi:hypothetical protein
LRSCRCRRTCPCTSSTGRRRPGRGPRTANTAWNRKINRLSATLYRSSKDFSLFYNARSFLLFGRTLQRNQNNYFR